MVTDHQIRSARFSVTVRDVAATGSGRVVFEPASQGGQAMLVKLGAAGAAIAGVSALQLPFACSPPPPKPCVATVSAAQPTRNVTELVYVTTGVANSPTAATAYYKTTRTAKAGRANDRGHITFAFDISDATIGYKVVVGVTYAVGSQVGRCSTSFTPKAG